MRRDYHRWFSHTLQRDLETLVFGHGGTPMFVFPTSMGSFFEYEDRGMVAALADKLDAGALQLFCVQTVDSESLYANDRPPRARLDRYLAWEHALLHELVPLARQVSRQETFGATGCSFGAYHAFTMALRHPDVFTSCVTMGGAFDVTRFLDGYYDQDAYLLCPPHFLPGLTDPWVLDRLRRNKWVLVTGEHDICRAATEQAAALLGEKAIPHSLHVWGHGSLHDWPEWVKMARAYLP
jgi:esterase/lipase superfamily enzyme